jgi:hypothetical protein
MRFTWKDALVTILVAAVAVPYIGYLVRGSMPFIEDPRGMAATGLVLGLIAAAVTGRAAFTQERFGRAAEIVAFMSLGTGLATLIWAESGTLSDVLLAAFMGTMVLTWALVMVEDSGLLAGHRPTGIAAH